MDGGREHFSIWYEYDGKYHMFHVDFIAKLKDGTIFISDTKEDRERMLSDKGIAKSIGLQQYIKAQRSKGIKIMGGIVTRNKLGKLKIWVDENPYKLDEMLYDWENLEDIISQN
jgi:hypothetical protein